ncbi:MAG: H(+)-transporting V1 sector ATPase subunit G [Piccolia ochrophora]|nr:MAG: H(+)-transporting V1 sector ATPase subunit G [Piccolia ochrophora]
MSAQNSAGIQTLLDAEREAQRIVQQAREYRTKRVKDARNEAQKEIEDYRKQKDEEFKKFETEARLYQWKQLRILQHSSGNKKAEEDADQEAESRIKEIKESGSKSGKKVVEDLLKAVTTVNAEAPQRVHAPPKA